MSPRPNSPRCPAPGPDAEPRRPPLRRTAAVTAATAALGAAIWLSTAVHPTPALREVALFAHLASLILGLGAVLVVDYAFGLWLLGRSTFLDAVAATARLHPLIWAGLVGLVSSGVLLKPDLASPTTVVKLGLVAALTVNGLHATTLGRRLSAVTGPPPTRLLIRGAATSAISQICWWGAVVIGYLKANA